MAWAGLTHRIVTADVVESMSQRLKLSNAETNRAVWLVRHSHELKHAMQMPWPQLQRLLISEGIKDLIALAQAIADATGADPAEVDYCNRLLSLSTDELNPPPLLTGNDLINHGVPPGPDYQRLLEAVRDAQLDKLITGKSEALGLVDRLRRGHPES